MFDYKKKGKIYMKLNISNIFFFWLGIVIGGLFGVVWILL